eukprot:gene11341-4509_t
MINQEEETLLSNTEISNSMFKKTKEYIVLSIALLWNQILQTFLEIKKRKFNYILGLLSCVIVVWMVSISYTGLENVALVFFRLAELTSGEYDLRLNVNDFMIGNTFNYTKILKNQEFKTGQFSLNSPRFLDFSNFYSAKSCQDSLEVPIDLSNSTLSNSTHWNWMYKGKSGNASCLFDNCVSKFCKNQVFGKFLVIDSNKERIMEFGRKWNYLYKKVPPRSIYISYELAKTLNVTVGEILIIPIRNLDSLFTESGILIKNETDILKRVDVPFLVSSIFHDYQKLGKFEGSDQYSIVAEYDSFLPHLARYLHPQHSNEAKEKLSKFDFYATASHLYFNYPNRLNMYKDSVFDNIQNSAIKFGSMLNYLLGFNQIQANFEILDILYKNRFVSLFLGLIINIIITVLSGLSIILIYSLLLINVENRTFEIGVMRMIGMSKVGVISLILMQSFSYALPGLILGLILSQGSYIILNIVLSSYLEVTLSYFLSGYSILLAGILGFLIPIISSILPIFSALGVSLREALDTTRSRTTAIQYKIERSSDLGINWTIVIVGSMMSLFGFSIHYFLPLSLISFNIQLLLLIFFGILILMKIGLTMLALNLENIIERTLCFIFFFWENFAVRSMIGKNLIAHRIRNRKTTIMYAVSLGFIIFISVSFNVQIKSVEYERRQRFGVKLKIQGATYQSINSKIGEIENLLQSNSIVTKFSYMSFQFAELTGMNTSIRTIGHYSSSPQYMFAVSPNFFETTGSEFLTETERYPSGWDPARQLYTSYGTSRLILGSLYTKSLKLGINSPVELRLQSFGPKSTLEHREIFKPVAFLSAAPGCKFSNFPLMDDQDILISFSTFHRLTKLTPRPIDSLEQVPIKYVYISINPYSTTAQVEELKFEIYRLGIDGQLNDVEEDLDNLVLAKNVMQLFFIFTTLVSMFMCFFSLFSSMYSNIFEQSKEIGILRAMGTRKFAVVRIYIYESFILIISSTIMGVVIGTVIAYSFVVQRVLFTQLPIPFEFPYEVVLTVFGAAIIFSIISTAIPIYTLMSDSVVNVMRRLN